MPKPGFLKRLTIAGVNLLVPFQTGLIVAYFATRALGRGDLWYVDAIAYILPWLFVPTLLLLPTSLLIGSRAMTILAAIPAALFVLTYGHLYLPRPPVRASGPTFSVMTYNVFARNPHDDQVASVIQTFDPDLIGLHELGPTMAQALESRLANQYPNREIAEHWAGLYSRYPILQCEDFRLGGSYVPEGAEGLWAQECVLDIHGKQVTVFNAHPRAPPLSGYHPFGLPLGIPVGFVNAGRDADIRDLLNRIDHIESPMIVIGDFNMTDQQGLYPRLTQRLDDAFRDSGWGMGFTFTRFPQIGVPMWRIDYIFHSSDLVSLHTLVVDYGGSDHRPVVTTLAFRASE